MRPLLKRIALNLRHSVKRKRAKHSYIALRFAKNTDSGFSRNALFGLLLFIAATPLHADESRAKFSVTAFTLTYNTEDPENESEIEDEDVETLREVLQANPDVATLVLNSSGGGIWAGKEMARIVLDYELNTVVSGECSSSCIRIFLAGTHRTMQRGSKMGFHSRSWSPGSIERYYNKWNKDEGWDTPFQFGSWIYKDTQGEVHEDLAYLVSRGVDPAFAIRSKAPREIMWYPLRNELREAGLLSE